MYLKIKELISWGRVIYAVDEMLMFVADKDNELHNDLILLKSSINQAKHSYSNGIVDQKDDLIRQNQFNQSALNILESIKNAGLLGSKKVAQSNRETEKSTLKILFISSSPIGVTELNYDKESKQIRQAFMKDRTMYDVIEIYNTTNSSMLENIVIEKPSILHISCHSTYNSTYKNFIKYENDQDENDIKEGKSIGHLPIVKESYNGLVFSDKSNNINVVSFESVANQIRVFREDLECVLFNAERTEPLAQLVSTFIPFVIGIRGSIGDSAAIDFVEYFYKAISLKKNIEDAFNFSSSLVNRKDEVEYVLYKQQN